MRVKPVFRRLDSESEVGEVVESARSVTFSDDQAQVFERVLDWQRLRRSGLLTLAGFAGTGKSTVTAELAREWRNVRVALCAYTGKAANNLRQKVRAAGAQSPRHSVGTIHSLIYEPATDPTTGEVLAWRRRAELDADLIVVDEASMVDAEMLADLRSYGIPILAVGDHGQLPPVRGEGTLMRDPDLRLERIHRQAEGSPIIQLSKAVRECGDLPRGFSPSDAVQVITAERAEALLGELYGCGEDVGVLTYTNARRQHFNSFVRGLLGRFGPTPEDGDSVLCLRNTDRTIYNGMRGVVRGGVFDEGRWWRGVFAFPDDGLEVEGRVLKSQFGRQSTYKSWEEIASENPGMRVRDWDHAGLLFDYGYALTCHKAQGSQYKHVFWLYERPWNMEPDEWRRWLYTCATRATDHLYVVIP